jgi:hypothetical protein
MFQVVVQEVSLVVVPLAAPMVVLMLVPVVVQ